MLSTQNSSIWYRGFLLYRFKLGAIGTIHGMNHICTHSKVCSVAFSAVIDKRGGAALDIMVAYTCMMGLDISMHACARNNNNNNFTYTSYTTLAIQCLKLALTSYPDLPVFTSSHILRMFNIENMGRPEYSN